MKLRTQLFTLIFVVFYFSVAQAQNIHLSVAASMTDTVKELSTAFEAQHPGAEILANFASSGSLAKQIQQGAPADIFISANPKWMQYLVDNQAISSENQKLFAYNKLVFVSSLKAGELSIDNIADMERIAIGNPESVPAGRYAQQAMQGAGIYDSLRKGNKFIFAKDVRQALMYADRGEVDGAFVYKTDALLARQAVIAFEVPEDLYDRVSYPIGLTISGENKELARKFYDFLLDSDAAVILDKYGFEPAQR